MREFSLDTSCCERGFSVMNLLRAAVRNRLSERLCRWLDDDCAQSQSSGCAPSSTVFHSLEPSRPNGRAQDSPPMCYPPVVEFTAAVKLDPRLLAPSSRSYTGCPSSALNTLPSMAKSMPRYMSLKRHRHKANQTSCVTVTYMQCTRLVHDLKAELST